MKDSNIKWLNLIKDSDKFYKFSNIANNTTYLLIPELYLINEFSEYFILYAPLLYRIYKIPKNYVESIDPLIFKKEHAKELIIANILFPKKEIPNLFPTIPSEYALSPEIRILLTHSCNLNCKYCYGVPNQKTTKFNFETLKTLLALYPEDTALDIEFHGNGEPTVAFTTLQKCYKIIINKFPKSKFTVQTNGNMTSYKLNWLLDNKIGIGFSLDGPKHIHDKQRPTVKGKSSYDLLIKNIHKTQTIGNTHFCITTISEFSFPFLDEIYFFLKQQGFNYIKMNPLLEIGNAQKSSDSTCNGPDLIEFTDKYAEILASAYKDKILIDSDLIPSVHTRKPSIIRCGAVTGKVTLDTNGSILACSDGYNMEPPESNPFFTGFIDSKGLKIDDQKQKYLNTAILPNYPMCKTCLAKWICCGGCKVENYLYNKDILKPNSISCEGKVNLLKKYLTILTTEHLQ